MRNRGFIIAAACLLCCVWLPAAVARAGDADPDDDWSLTGATARAEKDQPGFDTPEQAVAAYLEGLKNADLERMLAACATDILAKRQDFAAWLDSAKSFPAFFHYVPNTNSFLREACLKARRGELAQTILFQYALVLIPELTFDGRMLPLENEKAIGEFLALFGGERLGELSSLAILDMKKASEWMETPETYRTQVNMNRLVRLARGHGADEFENIVAAFNVGGRDYVFFPMVCRYDDKWLITDPVGNVADLLALPPFFGGMARVN